jgi:amino acid transporter
MIPPNEPFFCLANGMQVFVVFLAVLLVILSATFIIRHRQDRRRRIKTVWLTFGIITILVFFFDLINVISMNDVAGYLELGLIALLLGGAIAETIFDL